jgi:C4-dicarboxylate-specific signal transduction histidine kinase
MTVVAPLYTTCWGLLKQPDNQKTTRRACSSPYRIQLQQLLPFLSRVEAMDQATDRVRRLAIRSAQESADVAVVEIRDHAVGMEHPDNAFEAFFRTREYGMGVGLITPKSSGAQ